MAMEGADSGFSASAEGGSRNQSLPPRKSPPPEDHEEKTIHIKVLLTNAEAGSVIGKGGSTITDFQTQSGAQIQLSRNFEFFPGTSDRIIMVSGIIDDVLKAIDLLLSKVLEEFYVEEGGDDDPRIRVKLVVPNGSCGGIIGKGGSIIKSLIEASQARIKIAPLDSNFPGLSDRLVTIYGTLGEQMRAIELILLKCAEDPHYSQSANAPFPYSVSAVAYNGMHYAPNGVGGNFQNGRFQNKGGPHGSQQGHQQDEKSNSLTMAVADEHIGLVVGRGGRNISEISQLSGARIKISERGDFIDETSNRKVTITGSQRVIHAAQAMINQKLSSVSES